MSSAGNSYINLTPDEGGNYALQLAQLQRRQRLADQLQQESLEPIQGQTNAPYSWTQALAKVLQSYSAKKQSDKINAAYTQLGQQDQSASQALVDALTRKTNQVGTPNMPATGGTVDATAPQLPGGPTPSPVTAPVQQMPAQQGGGVQQVAPDMNAQLAAVLGARGGPQTQMIQQAILPQILGQQNMQRQMEMQRSQKEWENTLPISTAAQQEAALRLKNQEAAAQFENQLPMTAAAKAANALGYAQLSKPVSVPIGGSLVDPRTHQVVYSGAPSSDAIDEGVDYYISTGQFPPNARNAAMQQGILAGVKQKLDQLGLTNRDIANRRIGLHGQQVAAGSLAKTQAQTAVNEGTVNNSIGIVRKLLPTAASTGTFTDINSLEQNLSRRANDPQAVLLKNGIDSISNEYARVMTGATSGSPSSDAARREAGQRILYGYNAGTLDAVLGQMQQEMAGRSGAQSQILGNLTGGNYSGAPVPGQSQAGAKTVVRTGKDASGKKVVQYSDGSVAYAP